MKKLATIDLRDGKTRKMRKVAYISIKALEAIWNLSRRLGHGIKTEILLTVMSKYTMIGLKALVETTPTKSGY